MIFQKFQNFQKLHFDQKLRLRRYLAQPHVHVLKAPYAVVLSYDLVGSSGTVSAGFSRWQGLFRTRRI